MIKNKMSFDFSFSQNRTNKTKSQHFSDLGIHIKTITDKNGIIWYIAIAVVFSSNKLFLPNQAFMPVKVLFVNFFGDNKFDLIF